MKNMYTQLNTDPQPNEQCDASKALTNNCTEKSNLSQISEFGGDFMFTLGLFALLGVVLGLASVLLVTLILTAVILRLLNLVLMRKQVSLTLNQEACNRFEDAWLSSSDNNFPASTTSGWLDLPNGISAHYIHVPSSKKGPLPADSATHATIVLIHGTGSAAALAWASMAGQLAESFSLYAVDLPGFGRSTWSWEKFLAASRGEVEDAYADFISNYIHAMGLVKPIVVAHSIGGFFAIKFAKKYPDCISKLILVSPAGILPMPTDYGWYFAWLFMHGIPIRQIRRLGRIASFVFYSIFDFCRAGAKAYYWLQLNGSPTGFGDCVVARFLTATRMGLRLHWNRPALSDLLTAG
eukprot:415202-Rhodomonas_salina.1